MNIWWTTIWETPTKCTRTYKLNSKLLIKALKLCVKSPWTPTNSKKRLDNSNRKKSNSLRRSPCSKIKETRLTSKLFWKPLPSCAKNKRTTLVWMRKKENLPATLKSASISSSQYVKDSWTNKNRPAKTWAQNRCSWILRMTSVKTEKSVTTSSVESSMTRKSVSRELKWSFKNQWLLKLS